MATLHVTEAEAVRDIAALLRRVEAGDGVVVTKDNENIATIWPADAWTPPGEDPEYDAWVSAKVKASMDDPTPPIPSEVVEAYFAERKRLTRLAIQESGE